MQKFINSALQCNGINNANAVSDIDKIFFNALMGMYHAKGIQTICLCQTPIPFDISDEQLRYICVKCECVILEK